MVELLGRVQKQEMDDLYYIWLALRYNYSYIPFFLFFIEPFFLRIHAFNEFN